MHTIVPFLGSHTTLVSRAVVCLVLDTGIAARDLALLDIGDIAISYDRGNALYVGNRELRFGSMTAAALGNYLAQRTDVSSHLFMSNDTTMSARAIDTAIKPWSVQGLRKVFAKNFLGWGGDSEALAYHMGLSLSTVQHRYGRRNTGQDINYSLLDHHFFSPNAITIG